MPKLLWVLLPLVIYAVYLAVRAARKRAPSRHSLNVDTSLLLLIYLSLTAGLGLFWVARQQLPVFDWHYLFGYASIVLVGLHLVFNTRVVLRYFRRGRGRQLAARRSEARQRRAAPAAAVDAEPGAPLRARSVLLWLGAAAALVAAFGLGVRHGVRSPSWSPARAARDAVRGGSPRATPTAADLASRIAGGSRGPVELIERYHEASSISRLGIFSGGPGVDWGSAPPPFKRYAKAPRIELAPASDRSAMGRSLSAALRGPVVDAADGSTLAALSVMLFHTAGVTDDGPGTKLRAAPSSGALFATEVYVVARRVDGLAPGLYHYDAERHGLHHLRDGALSAAALGAPDASALDGAPLGVILTAMVRRVGHKYRDRAYRYIAEDAGHALENLRLAAGEVGLALRLLERFEERTTSAAIGVDDVEEIVVAIATLNRPATDSSGSAQVAAPDSGPPAAASYLYAHDAGLAPPSSALGAIAWAQLATSLRLGSASAPPAAVSATAAPVAGAIALPAPTAAEGRALETMATRRSHRRYTSEAVGLEQLSSMLHDAASPPPLLSRAVRYRLVATRVDGLEPGVYRYDPAAHQLLLERPGELAGEAAAAALGQDTVGDAAALFVLSLDRAQMLDRDGARGYRHGLLEVGLVGERFALGAVARGLGACPVGAFYDDEAAELLGVDPSREWVLHFVTLGRRDR